MFQLFFWEYKHTIYSTFFKDFSRLSLPAKVLFVIGFLLVFGIFIAFVLGNSLIVGVLLGASGLWIISVFIISCIYQKKSLNETVVQYKKETLEPLKTLLKDKRYSLYSATDIDWLISSCEAEIAAGKRPLGAFGSFSIFVIPIVITLTDAIIDNATSIDFSIGFVVLILCIWLLLCLFKLALSDVIDYIRFPNYKALLSLKSDLQYLRLELSDVEAKAPTSNKR